MFNLKNAIASGLKHISYVQVVLVVLSTIGIIYATSANRLIFNLREESVLPAGFHILHIFSALQSDTVASLLPIIAALPCAGKYIDDVKSKFARFFLIRTNYSIYLVSRVLVCFLSGGLVIFTGTLLAWGVSTLLFLPMERAEEAQSGSAALLLRTCALLFLNGGLWAVLGTTMSTVMESKYIAYCSPFIVYYLLVILYERYFPDAWLLYPKNWLNPEIWPYGIGSAALFLLELTFLCGLVFYIRGKRRLEQL